MSKSSAYSDAMLKLFFQAVAMPGLADPTGVTSLSVALHSADPGEGGLQTSFELAYGGYARASVARTAAGWLVANNQATPVAPIDFPTKTSGTDVYAAYFSVGYGGSNALAYSGAINPPIFVVNGTPPRLTQATAIKED